jgi:mono/diheme cytochrome c family protein
MRKILFASVLALICFSIVFAALQKQPWVVPEEAKQRKNPFVASPAGMTAAKYLYLDHCAQCHGETGKGDGSEAMMHDPPPADLTDAKHMSALTDGEIYYQISEGRKPMPAFKQRLSEEQRWQLVILVRSFAPPAPALPAPDKKPTPSGKQ